MVVYKKKNLDSHICINSLISKSKYFRYIDQVEDPLPPELVAVSGFYERNNLKLAKLF